jgi:hypothetical protein
MANPRMGEQVDVVGMRINSISSPAASCSQPRQQKGKWHWIVRFGLRGSAPFIARFTGNVAEGIPSTHFQTHAYRPGLRIWYGNASA